MAVDDFLTLLEATEVMKQVLKNMREQPAHLMRNICREYNRTGQMVPDHNIQLAGYMGEVALKALIEAGFVKQKPGGRLSVFYYEPTEKGLEQYNNLETSGFYHS